MLRTVDSLRVYLSKAGARRSSVGTDPLERVKRKAYLTAILAGLPAVLLVCLPTEPKSFVVRIGLSLFILFYLACVWGLWSGAVPIRLVERATFTGATLFAFAHLAGALYAGDLAEARSTITEVSYTTLTALYAVAYLVFDSRTALRLSLALYVLGLVAILLKASLQLPDGPSPAEISWLLRMHAYMGALIALFYTSSYLKDQLLQQRVLTETMHRLAYTDQLTGVANRRELYSALQKEMEKSERYGRPLSIILFDLDHFKEVNDTYGHDRGDCVLREIVRAVEPALRTTDRLGRWGGEEFIILAPETRPPDANRLAERLRAGIADRRSGPAPAVTASLGLAQYKAEDTPETFIRRADKALYKAKTLGRNRVEHAD